MRRWNFNWGAVWVDCASVDGFGSVGLGEESCAAALSPNISTRLRTPHRLLILLISLPLRLFCRESVADARIRLIPIFLFTAPANSAILDCAHPARSTKQFN